MTVDDTTPVRVSNSRIPAAAAAGEDAVKQAAARVPRASSTWAACDRDWARFAACGTAGEQVALPAETVTVAAYPADATRLTGRSINTIVAFRAAQAGLDGAYSPLRGRATEAITVDVPEHAAMRHRRSAATVRGHVAEADRFAGDNPTRHLGLISPPSPDAAPRDPW